MADEYINIDDLATRLGLSRRKLENMLSMGEMPGPVRFGRARRWSAQLIDEWMKDLAERAAGVQDHADQERRRPGRPRSG